MVQLSYSTKWMFPFQASGFSVLSCQGLVTVRINAPLKDSVLPLNEHFGQETKNGKVKTYLMISKH